MRTFVILACVCAVAFAQFGNQQKQTQSQRAAPQANYGSCSGPQDNNKYPVPGSCDAYIQCVNGTETDMLCPDGLRFNPEAVGYPCQYPNEYDCLERSALQPAQPTNDCPHQFVYLRLGDERNCSYFRNCVNGVAYDFTCPEGLAYNPQTYRCDWPDQVEECDAEAFIGFRCPEVPISRELGAPAGYRFYRAENDCQKYFICIDGKPRALTCGGYNAFDELSSTCVSADEVSACPNELRDFAAKSRELASVRIAKEIETNAIPADQRRRHNSINRF